MTKTLEVPNRTVVASLTDAILEVRFEADTRFMDSRGKVAEDLRAAMGLKVIGYGLNGVEVSSEDESEKAFVALGSLSLFMKDPGNLATFSDRAVQMLRKVASLHVFRGKEELSITRVGARGKFLYPFEGSFSDLSDKTVKVLGNPSSEALSVFGKIIDVGYTYNLESEGRRISLSAGPMKDEQVIRFFERKDTHSAPPAVGLFLDVDVFKESRGVTNLGQLEQSVRQGVDTMKSKAQNLQSLVFGA